MKKKKRKSREVVTRNTNRNEYVIKYLLLEGKAGGSSRGSNILYDEPGTGLACKYFFQAQCFFLTVNGVPSLNFFRCQTKFSFLQYLSETT